LNPSEGREGRRTVVVNKADADRSGTKVPPEGEEGHSTQPICNGRNDLINLKCSENNVPFPSPLRETSDTGPAKVVNGKRARLRHPKEENYQRPLSEG